MLPTSDDQIRFLAQIQRVLNEGLFVATYKFALLLALADLSIEEGDDSGAELAVSADTIAEKFHPVLLATSGSLIRRRPTRESFNRTRDDRPLF